jgi:WS/DGAT/MGAT family acyltransferase
VESARHAEEALPVAINRLSDEDALMLWPDEVWPQDVGALVMFEGDRLLDGDGRFRLERVRNAVAARLHLVPRFRQLLKVPPRRLGGPLWVDAPTFDIADHVRQLPLPAPADEKDLLLATERLRRRRLDRSRPLWEMWFLPGLPDRRVALFVRFHHAIADGMAGIATIASLMDADPDAPLGVPVPWSPAPRPSAEALLDDERRRRRSRRRAGLSRLAHPANAGRRLAAGWPAMRELLADPPYPVTSLDRLVGQDRGLALLRARLDPLKQVAHAHDATVNDVFLTAIAAGLRALLAGRGEPVEDAVLGVYVAISLHRGERSQARGNLISQMVVPLPICVANPVTRLREIATITAQRKTRPRPSLGGIPHGRLARRLFLRLVYRQHVNVTTADLPGPQTPLYLAGARLLEVFPMVQLIGRNSLAVGALSYAGTLGVMAVADRDAYPDLEVFTTGMQEALVSLQSTLSRAAG